MQSQLAHELLESRRALGLPGNVFENGRVGEHKAVAVTDLIRLGLGRARLESCRQRSGRMWASAPGDPLYQPAVSQILTTYPRPLSAATPPAFSGASRSAQRDNCCAPPPAKAPPQA